MKRASRTLLVILFITFLALAINIPDGYPLKFSVGGITVDRVLQPLQLNIVGKRIKIRKKPETVLGLDIAGGVRLVYEADVSGLSNEDIDRALESTRNTIERRINLFGVTEPTIQTAQVGQSYRVIVELPGVTEVTEAKKLMGKTAQLDFREFPETEEQEATDSAAFFFPTLENTVSTSLSGKDLKRASVAFDQNTGEPTVNLEFTPDGGALFEEVTKRNVGKTLPVFLDDVPITNPRVNEAITGGSAIISGNFTSDTANALSIQLNSGALPVPIEVVEEKTIGPTLGAESVEKSVKAAFVGLFIVMLFMWAYYGKLGLLANVALVVYGLIAFAVFRLIPITLTLPGLAGFILSIGMAVDSNILIFERIKEETRSGKVWQAAMEAGFGRAWDSIRDANVTTLLTCFILFNPLNWSFLPQFGLARGFAATLAIGIFVSLFTGIIVTRNLVRVFIKEE